ncbi:MAG: undecaprenyl-diphosphate phosphatase [Acidimicrobiales bacterium]
MTATSWRRTARGGAAAVLLALVALWIVPAAASPRSPAVPTAGDDAGAGGLSVASAVVLGLVEGLTEYLPVSSTGHLLVANDALGLGGTEESDKALDAYAICIQAGAILAVLVLYQRRVRQMLDGLLGRSAEGRTVLIAVVAAFVPTAIIGLAFKDVVRDRLFGVGPVAAAWLVGGMVILALERQGFLRRPGMALHEMTLRQALAIGLIQAIALWPGTSRSLVTIIGAVAVGLSLEAAVEFSFLLGLITLGAATVLTGASDGQLMLDTFGLVTPLIGLVVAFAAAVVSVRWMVTWLQQRSFDVFGWYRLAIGVVAVGLLAAGIL